MTEDELKSIENRAGSASCGAMERQEYAKEAMVVVPVLVAEVRRLRRVIALVQDRNEYLRSHGSDRCPWCGGDVNSDHDDGNQPWGSGDPCPAFTPTGDVR